MKKLSILVFLFAVASVYAADIPMEFEDAGQQQRYQQLLEELRCLVCQNQSLADSHADLAQDLRIQVYNMVEEGKPNQEIIDFLVQRYGDFVLYRPPVNISTILLWFGPFLLLIIGLFTVFRLARKSRPANVTLKAEERAQLSSLLDDEPDSGHK